MSSKGMGFLNKKSWHTGGFKNQERVWKREQEKAAEDTKMRELARELADERARKELEDQAIAHGFGQGNKQERVDFLYDQKGATQAAAEAEQDDYLLGKAWQPGKASEPLAKPSLAKGDTAAGGAVVATTGAAALGTGGYTQPSATEQWARLHADPLMAIKQREQAMRQQVRSNPVQMRQIRLAAEREAARRDVERRERKRDRKEKKRHRERDERGSRDGDGRQRRRSRSPARRRERSRSPDAGRHHRHDRDRDRGDRHRSSRKHSRHDRSRSRERHSRSPTRRDGRREERRDDGRRDDGRRERGAPARTPSSPPAVRSSGYGLTFASSQAQQVAQRHATDRVERERASEVRRAEAKAKEEAQAAARKTRERAASRPLTADERAARLAEMQGAGASRNEHAQRCLDADTAARASDAAAAAIRKPPSAEESFIEKEAKAMWRNR